jgi:hypothetical protein
VTFVVRHFLLAAAFVACTMDSAFAVPPAKPSEQVDAAVFHMSAVVKAVKMEASVQIKAKDARIRTLEKQLSTTALNRPGFAGGPTL